MEKSRIYIVENDSILTATIQTTFKKISKLSHVRFFKDGSALIDYLTIGHPAPNIILLNHFPPDLNGLETLSILKRHPDWHNIPVIFWCAEDSADFITEIYQMGVNSFVVKATNPDDLQTQIEFLWSYWFEVSILPRPPL